MIGFDAYKSIDSGDISVFPITRKQARISNQLLPGRRLVYIVNKKYNRIVEILLTDGIRTTYELYREAKWYRRLFMRKDHYVLQQEDFR